MTRKNFSTVPSNSLSPLYPSTNLISSRVGTASFSVSRASTLSSESSMLLSALAISSWLNFLMEASWMLRLCERFESMRCTTSFFFISTCFAFFFISFGSSLRKNFSSSLVSTSAEPAHIPVP